MDSQLREKRVLFGLGEGSGLKERGEGEEREHWALCLGRQEAGQLEWIALLMLGVQAGGDRQGSLVELAQHRQGAPRRRGGRVSTPRLPDGGRPFAAARSHLGSPQWSSHPAS